MQIIGLIVLILLCFCFAVFLFFCGIAYARFAFSIRNSPHSALHTPHSILPPVSVIICARNEANNLKKNISLVLQQDYPVFEVIAVDDCSWDSTLVVLKEMEKDNPRLRALQIIEDEVYKHGKKLAVTIGIKGAQYEHLVFIDADCYPASNNWLKRIMEVFDEKTDIVLGYGAYLPQKGLINKMIRMDTFRIGLQYLSLAVAGMPYMGIGRNLAYRKSLFIKQKGFTPYSQLPSGDDDLFVNKCATRRNTRIAAGKDSITLSEPKKNLDEWLRQKRRHVSTARYYTRFSKFILGLLTFSQYFFWISAVALLFFKDYRIIDLGIIAAYIIIEAIIQQKAMRRLGETKLFVYSLLLEWLLMFFFYPAVAISKLLFKYDGKW